MSALFLTGLKAGVSKARAAAVAGCLVLSALGASGCHPPARLAVPDNADRIASGEGFELIRTTTTRDGRLHVLDRTDETVVWVGAVRAGQDVVVDGKNHKITIDRQTVFEGLSRDHHYVVFLSNLK